MNPAPGLALLVATCGTAAAEDVLLLRSGEEMPGRIEAESPAGYTFRPTGLDTGVWIDRGRVVGISRRDAAVRVATASAAGTEDAGCWRLEAAVLAGAVHGDLDGDGAVTQVSTGRTMTLAVRDDLGGGEVVAGLRLLHEGGRHGIQPVFGLGVEEGSGTGDRLAVAAAAGIGLDAVGGRFRTLFSLGVVRMAYERTGTIDPGGGLPAERLQARIEADGAYAGLDGSLAYRMGPWEVGVLARLSAMQLSGTQRWSSDGGAYAGREELGPSLLWSLAAGAVASCSW